MLINAEEFRRNFYGILQLVNRKNEAIKIKCIHGDIALIGTDLIKKLKNDNIKGIRWYMIF